jgi:hypothetical protein
MLGAEISRQSVGNRRRAGVQHKASDGLADLEGRVDAAHLVKCPSSLLLEVLYVALLTAELTHQAIPGNGVG